MLSSFFIANVIQAQQKTVFRGDVMDSLTRKRIAGATVLFISQRPESHLILKTLSGKTGHFSSYIKPGRYHLIITKRGYLKISKNIITEGKQSSECTKFGLLLDFEQLSKELDGLQSIKAGKEEKFNLEGAERFLKHLDRYLKEIRR